VKFVQSVLVSPIGISGEKAKRFLFGGDKYFGEEKCFRLRKSSNQACWLLVAGL